MVIGLYEINLFKKEFLKKKLKRFFIRKVMLGLFMIWMKWNERLVKWIGKSINSFFDVIIIVVLIKKGSVYILIEIVIYVF